MAVSLLQLLVIWMNISLGLSYLHHAIVSDNPGAPECKWFDLKYHCGSLDHMFDLLSKKSKSVDVTVEPGNYNLMSSYPLYDLRNIRIRSSNQPMTVNIFCKHNPNVDQNGDTGVAFMRGGDLIIEYISINWCGMTHFSTSQTSVGKFVYFRSALYFANSTNIKVTHVTLQNNNGIGMAIVNSHGKIEIKHSLFANNSLNPKEQNETFTGGGGLYIEFTRCAPGLTNCSKVHTHNRYSQYIIDQCLFDGNNATYNVIETDQPVHNHYVTIGRGGGISIWCFGTASNNKFYISSSNFTRNAANQGGGINIDFRDDSYNNHVKISQCLFRHNKGKKYQGGGGALVGYVIYQSGSHVTYNNVTFVDCNFTENYALLGGGGGINWFGSHEPNVTKPTNHYEVTRCKFERNEAQIGSAMVISKEFFDSIPGGILSALIINNCSFINNNIQQSTKTIRTHKSASEIGAVVSIGFGLQFKGCTLFTANNSTAVVGDDAVIEFCHDSTVTFCKNEGLKGGAILLIEGAFLKLHPNSTVLFFENSALLYGGAIFVEMETPYEYIQSHICFMQYHKENTSPKQWNVTLKFTNNTSFTNNTIFSSTLQPCFKEYSSVAFLQYKFFIYEPLFANSTVATSPSNFKVNMSVISVSPGKVFPLPIQLIDELDHVVPVFVLIATCKNHEQGAFVLSPYQYTNGFMRIAGNPTETCSLELKTDSNHQISTTITVDLTLCPPGYYYSETSKQCECISTHLHGNLIFRCDISQFQAYVNPAYWVGYTPVNTDNANETIVGPCPFRYCYGTTHLSLRDALLPKDADRTLLNQTVCGAAQRTGTLCGSCIKGYSVVMNSPTFSCHDCRKKYFGVFFFLLSYIIPITVLFFLFMHCKIRITSGWFVAFLFFAQIVGSDINFAFNYRINSASPVVFLFSNILYSIYSVSNLELFQNNVFSYCLFENAGTIDILAFKLLAALYPLGLIIVYSLIRHCHRCQRCEQCMQLHRSITFGVSAFFVLCFAKVNAIAISILNSVEVQQYDIQGHWRGYKRVVYLQGDLKVFEGRHLVYSVFAIVVVVMIVIIPTVILFFHPLIKYLLGTLGLGESGPIKCIENKLRIHKLQLLFDTFQADYRRKYKFFAGLHFFLYRTLIYVIVMTAPTPSVSDLQLKLLVVLFAILVIHLMLRPFRSPTDNKVHSLVYVLLIILIGILYLFVTDDDYTFTIYLGTMLSYIPLLCLVAYIIWKLWQQRLKFFLSKKLYGVELEDSSTYERITDSFYEDTL